MHNKIKVTIVFLVLLAIILGGTAVFFFKKYTYARQNPQKIEQESVDQLIIKVSKLIMLPTGEVPSVATILDAQKLKEQQPFFVNASTGDSVLIYTNANKAILYNPTKNIIVEVAPLNIGSSSSTSPAPAPQAESVPSKQSDNLDTTNQ